MKGSISLHGAADAQGWSLSCNMSLAGSTPANCALDFDVIIITVGGRREKD